MEAIVEFDYDAEQEDELTLRVGNVIKNVVTAEGGWWEGELNGKKGMFPDNFVKLRSKETVVKKEEKREATQRKSVRELAIQFKDGVPMGATSAQKKKAPEVKSKKCKVLFDYKPENEDELELQVGNIIEFHREVEEGWWEGTLASKTGVFPSNFVEMIEEGEGDLPTEGERTSVTEKTSTGDKDVDFQEIKGKKIMGIGLGNIFQGGPIKLRNTAKKPDPGKGKPEEKEPVKPKQTETNPDAVKREKQTVERAVVRFAYTAEQPDELSLKEGDIVRVLDKNLEDEGWWRGEVNGKTGVFPDNFVELLPQQEEPVKAPKKPPPPSGKGLYPKLPDKTQAAAPAEEKLPVTKKELSARRKTVLTKHEVLKEEPAAEKPTSAPALKKPLAPPPVGKKPGPPQKPAEISAKPDSVKATDPPKPELKAGPTVKDTSRPSGPVENHHHGEGDKTDGNDTNFDMVESTSHKLVHLTALRAKGPKKRPPSTVLVLGDAEKDSEVDEPIAKPSNNVQPEKTLPLVQKEVKHVAETDRSKSAYRLGHVSNESHVSSGVRESKLYSSDTHTATPPPRPPEPSRFDTPPVVPAAPAASTASTVALTRLVEELQRELRDLKSHTVSKNEYNELRSEYQLLRQEFDQLRTTHTKKLRELMLEVDEEKKLRLNTQVEMERVKKLLAESNV
ncbi:SH3 domain-containing kinase-binding protein 1-like isoform X3 [Pomacea canaliculata]|uniref:SH3 domain-containing kinase-binding protein 1-like isoform X3 n=1 Tax=Pomacea canaliculata TaxID=400727 RepID=UPI000D733473|nr:SH3 domain-containing kinase-binding protein 1-like isoform X3 [Pomacea canaliculata]